LERRQQGLDSERFTTPPHIPPFTHRRRSQPRKVTASLSDTVRARCPDTLQWARVSRPSPNHCEFYQHPMWK
jgi:hypothetical protein